MTAFEKTLEPQQLLRLKGLLIVAVLLGLLGMHAVGSGLMTTQTGDTMASASAAVSAAV